MDGVLIVVLLLSAGAGLLLYGISQSTRPPEAEAARAWRIVFPLDAAFPAGTASAWFASLLPLLGRSSSGLSAEIRSEVGELRLSLSAPASFEAALRGQLAAFFPEARLEAEDLPVETEGVLEEPVLGIPFSLVRGDGPLRLAGNGNEPLLAVMGTLASRMGPIGLRLVLRPERSSPGQAILNHALHLLDLFLTLLLDLLRPAGDPSPPPASRRAASPGGEAPTARACLLVWSGEAGTEAEAGARALAAQVESAFSGTEGRGFKASRARLFRLPALNAPSGVPLPSFLLSAPELGTLFHLPKGPLPFLLREASRRSAMPPRAFAPSGEDNDLVLGEALLAEEAVPFGIGRETRRLHTYVVGKTGTGKSTLLAGIARQDLLAGRGLALLDPHGDLSEQLLTFVPPSRLDDVVYFNPADVEFPVGYNPLRIGPGGDRSLVASTVLSVLRKLHGEFWGPRMEHILKHALLALLEGPSPSFLDLTRLLTDFGFRQRALRGVRDPVVRAFFHHEFDRYDPRFRTEAVSPILNKVGGYLASPVVRHLLAQSEAELDLRAVMDGGKIFLANLAAGRIGEENAALLGGLLVAGFGLAALSRKDAPEEERRDFPLLVDEFQRFAGDAFPGLLSEARKFRLSLTLSHQYLSQVPGSLTEAVLGNVGSLAVFRVGTLDAPRLEKELSPAFGAGDLVHLPNHRFCFRTVTGGVPGQAFSARTLPVLPGTTDPALVIGASRKRWAKPRAEVELEVADRLEGRWG